MLSRSGLPGEALPQDPSYAAASTAGVAWEPALHKQSIPILQLWKSPQHLHMPRLVGGYARLRSLLALLQAYGPGSRSALLLLPRPLPRASPPCSPSCQGAGSTQHSGGPCRPAQGAPVRVDMNAGRWTAAPAAVVATQLEDWTHVIRCGNICA